MPTPIQSARAAKREEAYGQIIPLDGDAVLLPNSAIIEVHGIEGMKMRMEPPGWLLGTTFWRDQELPVISLEGLLGRSMPMRSRRSRLLVINSVGSSLNVGLLAVVCQGYPHLTAVNRSALQSVALESRDPDDLILARVRVANTLAIIPDLDAIEVRLARAMGLVEGAEVSVEDWEP